MAGTAINRSIQSMNRMVSCIDANAGIGAVLEVGAAHLQPSATSSTDAVSHLSFIQPVPE